MSSTYAAKWVQLLSEGQTTISRAEMCERFGISEAAARLAAKKAQDSGWLFSPAQGFYVIVPPEYRSWGVTPGEQFIDAAMKHARAAYYVGYLSAAAHHGATHQAAQVFQVVADRRIRDREIKGLRIAYTYRKSVVEVATQTVRDEHGRWRVATPETTLLDLLERPEQGGGLDNVLTVAAALPIDAERLVAAAARRGPAAARRAGWALERSGARLDLSGLEGSAKIGAGAPTLADSRNPAAGPVDRRWWIRENTGAEVDE